MARVPAGAGNEHVACDVEIAAAEERTPYSILHREAFGNFFDDFFEIIALFCRKFLIFAEQYVCAANTVQVFEQRKGHCTGFGSAIARRKHGAHMLI